MKKRTQLANMKDKVLDLADGSIWDVTDMSAATELSLWLIGDKLETEDFGIHPYIRNERLDKTVRATKRG